MASGQFVQDFIAWRKTRLEAKNPLLVGNTFNWTGDVALFLMKCYMKSQEYVLVTKRANSILQNVLNYYQSDKGLEVLKIPRPELYPVLKEFVCDDASVAMYTKYAQLSLLKTIYESKKGTQTPSKVQIQQVEDDIKALTSNTLFATHTMKFTFWAMADAAPEMEYHIYVAETLIPPLKEYLLRPEQIYAWMQEMGDFYVANQDTTDFSNNPEALNKLHNFKFLLDQLDPTLALSNEVLTIYNLCLLAKFATTNVKDTALTRGIIETSIEEQMNIVSASPGIFENTIGLISAAYGTLGSFYSKLTQAFANVGMDVAENAKHWGMVDGHVFSLDSIDLMKSIRAQLTPQGNPGPFLDAFNDLFNDTNFYRLANGLFICAQVAVLAYGFTNWNNLSTFDKSLFVTGSGLTVFDAVNALSDNRIFITIGRAIKTYFTRSSGQVVEMLGNMMEYVGGVMRTISFGIAPFLVFINYEFALINTFMNAFDGNWAHFALNLTELAATLGLIAITVIGATAWSGPVSIILTGVLILAGVIDLVWDFFHNIIFGDPINNFCDSCDAKYRMNDADFTIYTLMTQQKLAPPDQQALYQTLIDFAQKAKALANGSS